MLLVDNPTIHYHLKDHRAAFLLSKTTNQIHTIVRVRHIGFMNDLISNTRRCAYVVNRNRQCSQPCSGSGWRRSVEPPVLPERDPTLSGSIYEGTKHLANPT